MTKYIVSIISRYEIEIDGDVTPELTEYILDNHFPATLPDDGNFEDAPYIDFAVGFEKIIKGEQK
jgi:hypothetical protein